MDKLSTYVVEDIVVTEKAVLGLALHKYEPRLLKRLLIQLVADTDLP